MLKDNVLYKQAFARDLPAAKARENVRITPGAIVRISKGKDGDWAITQVPQVAAASRVISSPRCHRSMRDTLSLTEPADVRVAA